MRNQVASRKSQVASLESQVPGRRFLAAIAYSVVGAAIVIGASGDDARYSAPLPWKKPHLSRVFAVGYTDLGTNGRGSSEIKTLNGQPCVVGPTLGFDVDDAYAFDIDEPVELTLTYVPAQTTARTLVVLFDKSGGDGRGSIEVTPERAGTTAEAKLRLDRARFAGQGAQGTDFAIAARQGTMALCDVVVTRSATTKPLAASGTMRSLSRSSVRSATTIATVVPYSRIRCAVSSRLPAR
jgi:hypothetical protein